MENQNRVAEQDTTPLGSDENLNGTNLTESTVQPQTEETAFAVKFNHQTVNLTKDEAVKYAQQGMLFEKKFSPILEKLDYFAGTLQKSPNEVLDGLIKDSETKYREQLEEKLGSGDPVIEDLMAVYRQKQRQKIKNVDVDFDSQFKTLQAEFPSIKSPDDLPESVLNEASEPLLYSYLKYLHSESRKVEKAKQTEKETALASAGSVYSAEVESDIITAFLKGIEN